MPTMINIAFTSETTPNVLRTELLHRVIEHDEIVVETAEDLRFTHLRSCLAVVNALAFARSCQLRYSNEREFRPPPLAAHYSHQPNIHHAAKE